MVTEAGGTRAVIGARVLCRRANEHRLARFSEKILHAGAQGYGFLISGISISALLGCVFIGQRGTNWRNKGRLILLGGLWGSIGMFLFSLTNILWTALIVASL